MTIDTIVYEKKNAQTRIALLGDGTLKEIEIISTNEATEGNIYFGKVTHKIELAQGKVGFFVEIGDDREAFLNADEAGLEEANLTEGQSVVVQVAQEKRADKGARLVRSIQLVGQNLVYCPYRMNIEASSKIEDKSKISEYKELVMENTTGQEGWILRTSSVNARFDVIVKEMEELRNIFDSISKSSKTLKAPCLLYAKSNPLFEYIKKHKLSLEKIVLNDRNIADKIVEDFGDNMVIEHDAKAFENYGIEEAIEEALSESVKLPSGGRISIEETKACVAIDVDSGGDKANGSFGRLNMEAAVIIVKQIRLRNLSGKIVIDFAGASEYKYLKNVIEALEKELEKDFSKSFVAGLSRGGLVEIIRVRRRPTLADVLNREARNGINE